MLTIEVVVRGLPHGEFPSSIPVSELTHPEHTAICNHVANKREIMLTSGSARQRAIPTNIERGYVTLRKV